MRTLLLTLVAALLLAAPAAGGGFATAGLTPPETGLGAGDTWNAEVTIRAHGVTPVEGLSPYVTITNGETTKRFDAAPTDTAGVYLAEVTFPSEGTWRYSVSDGYAGQTHTFKPVQIGPDAGGGGGFTVPDWTWGLVAGLGALIILLVARRVRPATAPTRTRSPRAV